MCVCVLYRSRHTFANRYACTTIPYSPFCGILSQLLLFKCAAAGKPGVDLLIVDCEMYGGIGYPSCITLTPPPPVCTQLLLFECAAAGKPGFKHLICIYMYVCIYISICLCMCVLYISIHMFTNRLACTTIPYSPFCGILSQLLSFECAAAGKPGVDLLIVDRKNGRRNGLSLLYRTHPPPSGMRTAPVIRARRRGQAGLRPSDCRPRNGRRDGRRYAHQSCAHGAARGQVINIYTILMYICMDVYKYKYIYIHECIKKEMDGVALTSLVRTAQHEDR